MKRYQWFAYSAYYPYGGSNDIAGEADTLDELSEAMMDSDRLHKEYIEVLDLETREWLPQAQAQLLLGEARAGKGFRTDGPPR